MRPTTASPASRNGRSASHRSFPRATIQRRTRPPHGGRGRDHPARAACAHSSTAPLTRKSTLLPGPASPLGAARFSSARSQLSERPTRTPPCVIDGLARPRRPQRSLCQTAGSESLAEGWRLSPRVLTSFVGSERARTPDGASATVRTRPPVFASCSRSWDVGAVVRPRHHNSLSSARVGGMGRYFLLRVDA